MIIINVFFPILLRLVSAAAAGALIGYERGRYGRAAGMRTHMLVCTGAALTVLSGIYITTSTGFGDAQRIAAAVVSGIGFIGAGTILLKGSNKITGLTTAAALWATATVGIAFGAGYYTAGVIEVALIYVTLTVMIKFETHQKKDFQFFIEIEDVYETNRVFDDILKLYPNAHSTDILPSKSGMEKHVGITVNIMDTSDGNGSEIVNTIKALPGVVYIVKE